MSGTWPPRVWVNPNRPIAAWTTDESKSLGNVEYLSLSECEYMVRIARTEAFEKYERQLEIVDRNYQAMEARYNQLIKMIADNEKMKQPSILILDRATEGKAGEV